MTTQPIVPSWTAVGASVILVVAAVVLVRRPRLDRDVAIAAVRAGVQLVAVGAVLLVVFRRGGLLGSAAWIAAMVAVATQVAAGRANGLPRRAWAAAAGIGLASLVTLGALVLLRVIPATPHVLVPVGGMIVSGAMQATALGLLRLREAAETARPAIEARLSLGLPGRAAIAPHTESALRAALLPAIDATKVVGLISLPGAMTGLILAGVDPLTAIRYQIVVMWMLLAATSIAAFTATRIAEAALFDDAQRLRHLTAAPRSDRTAAGR